MFPWKPLLIANNPCCLNCVFLSLTNYRARNRPDIRQNPVPVGYPALISSPGSGPVYRNFSGYFLKIFLKFIFFSKLLLRGIKSVLSVNSKFMVACYLSANVKDPFI